MRLLVGSFVFLVSIHAGVAATNTKSQGYSEAQIDGMTSGVVDGLWSRADYWWHKGDYPRVIGDDRLITEADPHFLEPYSNGGWLMESMGDNSDAEKYYRLGATRNPKESYLWFNLGFFYFNTMHNYPMAIHSFAISSSQEDAGINDWKMLAHSYEKNKQFAKAIVVWKKLQSNHPQDQVIAHNLERDEREISASDKSAVH
jgi:tetratricopeptide (TPR) repeat protein